MNWDQFRAAVPAVEQCIYLDTAGAGPLCSAAHDAMRQTLEQEHAYGHGAPPVRAAAIAAADEARTALARLVGAPPDSIVLTSGAAHAMNLVFSGLAFTFGDQIVITDAEQHSLIVPAAYARRRHGLGLRPVSLGEDMSEAQILDVFDEAITRRTRLVAISQVSPVLGMRLPVRRIADIAHARGALILVDGSQSTGQFEVNAPQIGADFFAISGHRWLLGPNGTGGLYIRRDLIDHVDAMMVTAAATRMYDVKGGIEPHRGRVEKFELNDPVAPLWAGLTAAIRSIEMMSLSSIEMRVSALASRLTNALAALDDVQLFSPQPGPQASGLVSFAINGARPDDVTAALWEGGNIVAHTVVGRPAVRLAPHAFNTPEEIDQVVAFIAEMVERARRPLTWNSAKRA